MDGYSRMLIYLRLANNNRAETVLNCFKEGIREFGIPSRVRSDKGMENVFACDLMLGLRGCGRSTWICGKSVHNQRIERYWVDLQKYTDVYYLLFL
jgi:hypothetical protein